MVKTSDSSKIYEEEKKMLPRKAGRTAYLAALFLFLMAAAHLIAGVARSSPFCGVGIQCKAV
jgi:hypothetical protein